MKTQKIKLTAAFSAAFFFSSIFAAFGVADAAAQKLKPGEIVYSRRASVNIGGCVDASVWAVGASGANDRLLFTNALHPRISPDGRFILFKRFNPSFGCGPNSGGAPGSPALWRRELATGRETLVAPARFPVIGHFFSPETNRGSNQIIYDENRTICRMNADGTNRFCTTPPLNFSFWAHPSVRGGDNLVVISNNSTNSVPGLYTYDYELTNPQKIPNTGIGDLSAAWSNHGLEIAFGNSGSNSQDIFSYPYFLKNLYKIKPDGSNKTQLTFLNLPPNTVEGFAYGMIWTKDNTEILAAGGIGGVTGIYRIAANGGGILGRIPLAAGKDVDWVGGIVPVTGERQVASIGGGAAGGGNFSLVSTIGQAFAGQTSTGGAYDLRSGFWADIPSADAPFDFDGDGKTDVGIFRPTDGSWWYVRSSDAAFRVYSFGISTDRIVPADFTGDGKADLAVFRASDGEWFIQRSEDNSFFSFPFGAPGDLAVPADYDGDRKTDAAVFRPSTATWFILNSGGSGTGIVNFGTAEDKPVPADFDGDGRTDIAIFRPSDGSWWYVRSSDNQFRVFRFGSGTDKPVPGDYTGDGRADLAVFRPASGEWFVQRSEDNSYFSLPFGASGDLPVPGDYDGDGRFDTSVFRPSTSTWYLNQTTAGVGIVTFGIAGDRPVPNAFVP